MTEAAPFEVHNPRLLAVHQLDPAPYNPRRIKPQMLSALKESIKTHGFVDPIIVRKDGMVVIAGHQRLKALKEICVEEGASIPKIPCVVIDVDERAAKKLNIALNKVSGEFDARLLGELLIDLNEEIKLEAPDIELMGFTSDEFGKYVKLVEPVDLHIEEPHDFTPDEPGTFAKSATLSLEFSDIRLRDAVKNALVEKATIAKQKTGELVADLLGCKTV